MNFKGLMFFILNMAIDLIINVYCYRNFESQGIIDISFEHIQNLEIEIQNLNNFILVVPIRGWQEFWSLKIFNYSKIYFTPNYSQYFFQKIDCSNPNFKFKKITWTLLNTIHFDFTILF